MGEIGKSVKIVYNDSNGEEHTITSMGCDPKDADIEIGMNDHDAKGWEDFIDGCKEWSMTIDFSWDDPFDEMMFLRLQAEMYAEQFKN